MATQKLRCPGQVSKRGSWLLTDQRLPCLTSCLHLLEILLHGFPLPSWPPKSHRVTSQVHVLWLVYQSALGLDS